MLPDFILVHRSCYHHILFEESESQRELAGFLEQIRKRPGLEADGRLSPQTVFPVDDLLLSIKLTFGRCRSSVCLAQTYLGSD